MKETKTDTIKQEDPFTAERKSLVARRARAFARARRSHFSVGLKSSFELSKQTLAGPSSGVFGAELYKLYGEPELVELVAIDPRTLPGQMVKGELSGSDADTFLKDAFRVATAGERLIQAKALAAKTPAAARPQLGRSLAARNAFRLGR